MHKNTAARLDSGIVAQKDSISCVVFMQWFLDF